MNSQTTAQNLRDQLIGNHRIPSEVLEWISKENLWNIWVPQTYGGLEKSLTEGLRKLKSLAKIDGSLGWTVTQCSGANYFVGNFKEAVAREIFTGPHAPVLGGSGGAFGTATKQGDQYTISGKWRYATGAPYLSHVTFNANIMAHGEEVKNRDGTPQVRSFVVPKEKVTIIEDWNAMGMAATATHSFTIEELPVHRKYRFWYNHSYLPGPIYKLPSSLFAYLTLWANYVGMAEHYWEESMRVLDDQQSADLKAITEESNQALFGFSAEVERLIRNESTITETYMQQVHQQAADSVRRISEAIVDIHPLLGMKASRRSHQLNQIFRDYFTATQHIIFANR